MKNNALRKNLNLLNSKKRTLTSKYHVGRIGIFGSVARGDYSALSDIDILVELSKPIGMFRFIELEQVLSLLLGKRVDLVTKEALKPMIKKQILDEVVYA